MEPQSITIRPAISTWEDGLQFAHYMNSAADGGFRKMFGKRFEEIVSKTFLEPNHDLSFETALFAERNGEIVGMVSGYTCEQYKQFSKDVVNQYAGRSIVRISLIYALIAPMMRFLHTYEAGDFYIEFLAVHESHRGLGIGSTLLLELEKRARTSQASRLAIDVATRNATARKVYERYGFATIGRWPNTRLLRPSILRMVKPL